MKREVTRKTLVLVAVFAYLTLATYTCYRPIFHNIIIDAIIALLGHIVSCIVLVGPIAVIMNRLSDFSGVMLKGSVAQAKQKPPEKRARLIARMLITGRAVAVIAVFCLLCMPIWTIGAGRKATNWDAVYLGVLFIVGVVGFWHEIRMHRRSKTVVDV